MDRTTISYKALFYSLTVVLGLYLALGELDAGRIDNFARFCLLVSAVFAIELFSSWLSRRSIPQTHITSADRSLLYTAVLHHVALPAAMFSALVGFAYFNRQQHIRLLLLGFTFVIFAVLFVNIRAYYEHKFPQESRTNYIYDVIKFFIFFYTANSLLNIAISSINFVFPLMGIGLTSFTLLALLLMRYRRLELAGLVLGFIFSLLMMLTILVFIVYTPMPVMQLSLLAAISFYLSSAFIYHQMRRDLTPNIILEYLAVIAIAISILYGLS